MEQVHDIREAWLDHGVHLITPRFVAAGYTLPKALKVACGFAPGARGGKALGVCISPKASRDGRTEMFVSPTIEDALTALGVLIHEMAHAAVGVEAGHGAAFKACCQKIGLEGKATQAMPGSNLNAWLRETVLPEIGAYPHAAVDPNARKKQATRMIKLVCPETGYTVRTTKKWIEQGYPTSPAGCEMVPVGEDEGEE
jgi:hypothetical protein